MFKARSDENQHRHNTKRIGRPAKRTGKGHPLREARRQRAYARGGNRPKNHQEAA